MLRFFMVTITANPNDTIEESWGAVKDNLNRMERLMAKLGEIQVMT